MPHAGDQGNKGGFGPLFCAKQREQQVMVQANTAGMARVQLA